MLDRLVAFLSGSRADPDETGRPPHRDELHLAAAALLVEAAGLDGHVDQVEDETIRTVLQRNFGLSVSDADALVAEASRAADETTEIYGTLRVIRERLAPSERLQIIEMLWEVAYADGELHDYEANLARRVAGLLYVTDQESGEARKRVLERMGEAR